MNTQDIKPNAYFRRISSLSTLQSVAFWCERRLTGDEVMAVIGTVRKGKAR